MSNPFIPVLPETAPFTLEQRAYLNGFFAGIFSRAPLPGASAKASELCPLTILFGSQTGNAEKLAKRIAKEAARFGFAPTVHDLANYPTAQLAGERHLLLVTSTYGDGDPPDNARPFWEFLNGGSAPRLPELSFSLCALGDMNYAKFCRFGQDLDARLEKLGAKRVHLRADCDVEFEEVFVKWMHAALGALSGQTDPASPRSEIAAPQVAPPEKANGFSRANPFPARLIGHRRLNASGSEKDVRHLEISLEGSGLTYEVGDALGVMPHNHPALVAELLSALGASGEEIVPGKTGEPVPLREALIGHYEITRIPKTLLEALAAQTGDDLLKRVSAPDANGELTKFLWGRQVVDVLLPYPAVRLSPPAFVGLLRKLSPRLYSIASSPKAQANQVHLTVSAVRFEHSGRPRGGACSTFLADRVSPETTIPVFVQSNPGFRPPAPDVPLIMIGPGTGIAPFRAFLQERAAAGATGRNWLFFGDQKSSSDFLYREELETFQRTGLLTRLDLAWSRDQQEKIYVQHRMLAQAREVFDWLEQGAAVYVCGDANRMARDVDTALRQVIESGGGRSPAQAADYVTRLTSQKRYQRDVY